MDEVNPETIERKRVAFALARVTVEKVGALPADAAAAWLYELVRGGAIEAWYTPCFPGDPHAKSPRLRRDRFMATSRVTAPAALPTIATEGFIKRCEVVGADVDREVALAFAVAREPAPKIGRKAKPIWATIEAEAAEYAHIESGIYEPMIQADLERYIAERLQAHREDASESTIRRRAAAILKKVHKAHN